MLRAEDNKFLTESGAGTGMRVIRGNLGRRSSNAAPTPAGVQA